MCGTRDAARNCALEYSNTLVSAGIVQGRANPCVFRSPSGSVAIMVHGDDFVAVGDPSELRKVQDVLMKTYAT